VAVALPQNKLLANPAELFVSVSFSFSDRQTTFPVAVSPIPQSRLFFYHLETALAGSSARLPVIPPTLRKMAWHTHFRLHLYVIRTILSSLGFLTFSF